MPNRPFAVLSVATPILGNAVYHANLCASLKDSEEVNVVARSVSEFWDFRAKLLFATVGSPKFGAKSYRYRAEWVMSEVARRGIRKALQTVKPDVIHCHTQAHALRCVSLAKKIPFVVSMDATSQLLRVLPQYAEQDSALRKLVKLERRLFSACAVVGGVSRWVTTSVKQHYRQGEERVRLCSPCVDTNFFRPPASDVSRAENAKLRVVFVGNDLVRKGGQLLIDVVGSDLSELCELHIVSGTSPPSSLPANVTWHQGLKPRTPELLAQLQQADIFALPTQEDCFPQALIEAMACGLPLISTQVMGVPELVQTGINGFCLPPGNRIGLVSALSTLAGDQELRRRFSAASRRAACEQFSFQTSRVAWEEALTTAAGSKLRKPTS